MHIWGVLLQKALEIMNGCSYESQKRFSIEFLTYDKKRKTGARRVALKHCYTTGLSHNQNQHGTIGIHEHNGTNPIPVHIRLIMKINNEFIV